MPVNLPDTFFTKLDNLGLLEVSGDDAENFLQSQLTSDIKNLTPGKTQYSSWCNPQGRIMTTLLIYQHDDRYLITVPQALTETFKNQIAIYVLRSKVSIISMDNNLELTGITGHELINTFKETVEKVSAENILFLDVPDGMDNRVIMVSPSDMTEDIIGQLPGGIKPSPFTYWQYQDILSGFVWIDAETTTKHLPQELGLQRLNALSFDKGCFPGQEVIARLHYRGKQKYGLYHGILSGTQALPSTGQRLYLTDSNVSIGTIVSVVKIADQEVHCLAILNHEQSGTELFSIENDRTVKINFSAISENR